MKKTIMVILSGGLASTVDVLHQASQGYMIWNDLGHIGAAFGAGAAISLIHILTTSDAK